MTSTLTQLMITTLHDHKALNISELDVRSLTDATDMMIVCTATSTRHAKTLADKCVIASKKAGFTPFGVEGEDTGEWVLIDLIDVVVHIMLAEQRQFYNLEKLWAITEKTRAKNK